jgi:hypothetical protein
LKGIRMFVVAWLVLVMGSCVILPVTDDSSHRPPAPPPPVDRIEKPAARISDLEALPARFSPGRPIDFVVKINNSGGHGRDFDIGVFHEQRLVGWTDRIEIPRGASTFRLKDDHFEGEPGSYIVRLRHRGAVTDERKFSAWPTGDGRFTIDPGQAPREKFPDERHRPDGRHSGDTDRHGPPPWEDGWLSIVNLESDPLFFVATKPIDFVVKILNKGPASASGFDVGIFHEGRLVAWETGKVLNPGENTFRVRDDGFTGDPGNYIVKVRRAGHVIDEKAFATYKKGFNTLFTLDPSQVRGEEKRPFR